MIIFLALALKRDCHPPENILKFNVPGKPMPLFSALTKDMAVIYMRSKNYLTFFTLVKPHVWLVLCARMED